MATTYATTPRIMIGGSLRPAQMRDLLSLSVEEDVRGLCSLEARFVNWNQTGYVYLDRSIIDFGVDVRVAFGPEGAGPHFTGRISAICPEYPASGAAVLGVCAEDRLQDLRMTRRTRTFSDSTTADIASRLASDHGLTPRIDLDGPTRRAVNQLNLSDLAFLRQLAGADGGEVWLDGTTLHVQSRADRDRGTVTLTYGADLTSLVARADLAHQVTDVTVTGWSVSDKDAITGTGDSSALGAELASGDRSGSEVLATAFAERHERLVVAQPLASDDARSRAGAAYRDRARRFLSGTATTGGTPEVRVGTLVTLAGLGSGFNGDYRVTRTCHRYDLVNGYGTEFDVERAGIGAA